MKYFYLSLVLVLFFAGCSQKSLPKRDISDAKMAIAKADNAKVRKYLPKMLKRTKKKYKRLQKLITNKEYERAKYLAEEIQADSRVMIKKSSVISLEHKIKEQQEDMKDE